MFLLFVSLVLSIKILGLVTPYLSLLHQTPIAKIIPFSAPRHPWISIQSLMYKVSILLFKVLVLLRLSIISLPSHLLGSHHFLFFDFSLQVSHRDFEWVFYNRALKRQDNIPSKLSSLVLCHNILAKIVPCCTMNSATTIHSCHLITGDGFSFDGWYFMHRSKYSICLGYSATSVLIDWRIYFHLLQ